MFEKGQSGNPKGRPRGIQDKRLRYRKWFDNHGDDLIEKAISLALNGDTKAMQLCLERFVPKMRDNAVSIKLPEDLSSVDALKEVGINILKQMEAGSMTPEEAKATFEVVKLYRETLLNDELEKRIKNLEVTLLAQEQTQGL